MGKLKNALMELQDDDMRFGQSIEDFSTDALILLQAQEDIDDDTRVRVEHELSRRNGVPVERIAVDKPDSDEPPHMDLAVYDLYRIAKYFEENAGKTFPHRHDIKEYLYRIEKVLEENSGN